MCSLKSECRMSTIEVALETEGANTEGANLLRRNSNDVGWEYGVLVDANNKDKVRTMWFLNKTFIYELCCALVLLSCPLVCALKFVITSC